MRTSLVLPLLVLSACNSLVALPLPRVIVAPFTDATDTTDTTDTTDSPSTTESATCPPGHPYKFVSAGIGYSCGIHDDGCIQCWGMYVDEGARDSRRYFDYGTSTIPAGTFTAMANARNVFYQGDWHMCAIKSDRTVICWGRNDEDQASAPAGEFTALALTALDSCGLRVDGTVACWGPYDMDEGTPTAPGFAEIEVGEMSGCARHPDGYIQCWAYSNLYRTLPISALDIGYWSHLCIVALDGTLQCMTIDDEPVNERDLPTGDGYARVCLGTSGGCALRTDGTVDCWGRDLAPAPEGVFTQVACGIDHACGLTAEGAIHCWGDCPGEKPCDPPEE